MCVAIPQNDPLRTYKCGVDLVEGSENDVLGRYAMAYRKYKPDYVCRITSDCPLIPAFIITKHIYKAVNHSLDYVSNTDPRCRTAVDGFDCELVSSKLFEWLDKNAVDPFHREHVTNLLYTHKPDWCKTGHVVSYLDNSHLKLSVDTKEDLEFVRAYHEILQSKIEFAKNNGMGFFRI